ncbi:hypothetical protein [Alkalisalibacterium limincola]|uniref:hypothetical protein n=1 Tax=Alkalisalibacterium limincola TaxID=2699169 RepID=UPI001650BB53|nr:hypothetical protein [Alkalisalibacterium limincola]
MMMSFPPLPSALELRDAGFAGQLMARIVERVMSPTVLYNLRPVHSPALAVRPALSPR